MKMKETDIEREIELYIFRERDFYAEKGVPCPKDVELEHEKNEKMKKEEEESQTPDANANTDYHRSVSQNHR